MNITVFDTSICSKNLGDNIIMDAVKSEIQSLFKNSIILYTPTHEKISKISYNLVEKSAYSFVGGTNLLSSNMNDYNQWKINLIDAYYLNNILLMGVGWWQYQKVPNRYTNFLFNSILHNSLFHSVRDGYTEKRMKAMGFNNVLNTACPTMWRLTDDHCKKIPKEKAENVVFTLTDYNKDPNRDRQLIELLKKLYNRLFFWPQGTGDLEYLKKLDIKIDEILLPNLTSFKSLLSNKSLELDYVGTRLHAGILALDNCRRALIIGIDNRAVEKQKDFNIPVCIREDLLSVKDILKKDILIDLKIPFKKIEAWKNQFLD